MTAQQMSTILVWCGLYAIAIGSRFFPRSSSSFVYLSLQAAVAIFVLAVLVNGTLGFCMSGEVGLIGNSVLAPLWYGWFVIAFVRIKRPQSADKVVAKTLA